MKFKHLLKVAAANIDLVNATKALYAAKKLNMRALMRNMRQFSLWNTL